MASVTVGAAVRDLSSAAVRVFSAFNTIPALFVIVCVYLPVHVVERVPDKICIHLYSLAGRLIDCLSPVKLIFGR